MELNFTKKDGWYVAEFEATGDFNVHIEREAGNFMFYQKTAGGEYDHIYGACYLDSMKVFDRDFVGLVYPKSIRIKSETLPSVAVVTMSK